MNRLLEIGFQPVGHWLLGEHGPVPHLRALSESRNILYAFVTDGEVKYIGKTVQNLKARMLAYQRPSSSQSTNIRNNRNIHDLLRTGKTVDIFGLPDNGLLHYGAFHINLAAGLEDSLISVIRPEWNGQRTATATFADPEEALSVRATQSCEPTEGENDLGPNADGTEPLVRMPLTLQATYFNQGFFNVPVEFQRYFGSDLEKIDIYCGLEKLQVAGYINRTANSNGTPRIMGGAQLKRWMQKSSSVMGEIDVAILSPTSISLTVPRVETVQKLTL